ncbi:MAG: methionine biosynthesis protein MetW [Candidatus Brocadiae bacterium]|nr:methionine biosynthesis protein MetW [Candidatus Brocadiia bacterium]
MPVRLDYRMIEEYVEPGAEVLDLGCGDGALLDDLIRQKGVRGFGIDVDLGEVQKCIGRGVPVYHGDMLEGMAMFEDGRFDCVILSQTLQQTLDPYGVVQEMLRVGRRAIISFPNFAHWKVRLQLLLLGKMPVTRVLPYTWHNTPNIRVLAIKDFINLCRDHDLEIIDRIYMTPEFRRLPGFLANLRASLAMFVVETRRPE